MVGGSIYFLCIEWNVVRHVEWHVRSIRQTEGHIKEVYDLFVGFDCNFKAMLAEDIAKTLLNFRAIKIPHRPKVIREGLGFRIPRCGFQIPCLWIPYSKALTSDSTDQTLDSGLTYMG